jgi:4-hydroxy-tetrahydrodipicolinate reductase
VNLFFKVNAILAEMMNQHPEYGIYTEEIHHTRKKDAPSGTAITLANAILERIERKAQWTLNEANHKEDLVIYAKRIGDVTGTHEIVYDSEIDSITIRHEAKNRKGFAYGAIIAAEWLVNQKNSGTYTMTDML